MILVVSWTMGDLTWEPHFLGCSVFKLQSNVAAAQTSRLKSFHLGHHQPIICALGTVNFDLFETASWTFYFRSQLSLVGLPLASLTAALAHLLFGSPVSDLITPVNEIDILNRYSSTRLLDIG